MGKNHNMSQKELQSNQSILMKTIKQIVTLVPTFPHAPPSAASHLLSLVEVRRAGTPPKRAVCSPLRSNTRSTPEQQENKTTTRHGAPSPLRTRPASPTIRKASLARPASPLTPSRPIRTKTPIKSTSRVSTLPSSAMKSRSSMKLKKDRTSPHSSPLRPEDGQETPTVAVNETENPFDALVNDSSQVNDASPQLTDEHEPVAPALSFALVESTSSNVNEGSVEADEEADAPSASRLSIFGFAEDYDEVPDMGTNIWRDSMGCCLDEIRNFKSMSHDGEDEDAQEEQGQEGEDEEDELTAIKRLRFEDDETPNDNEDDFFGPEEGDDREGQDDQHLPENQQDTEHSATEQEQGTLSSIFDEATTPSTTPSKVPRPRAASTTKKRPSRTHSLTAETASSAAKTRTNRTSVASVTFTPKAPTPVFHKKSRSQSSNTIESTMADGSLSIVSDSPTDKTPSYARPREGAPKPILDTAPLKITTQQWQNSLRKAEAPKRNDRKQPTARERAKQYDSNMLRAMRQDTKGMMPDGRPSIDTMAAQWEFMRDQFLGSNENLEWMMTAKQGGEKAYKLALKKFQMAEDQ
jgi:hypothetical protein